MTMTELPQTIAHGRGLAVGLVFDPDAEAGEGWTATVGLKAFGAGTTPEQAIGAALVDLSADHATTGALARA